MSRPVDDLRIELIGEPAGAAGDEARRGKVLDAFTSFSLTNDITSPSEASFEIGDDGTWAAIEDFIALGAEYRATLNGQLRLTGRVELNDVPLDAGAGAVVRFTIRTKLMDAQYASADEKVRVKKVSIKDFLLALYSPLGYSEGDFVFKGSVARDLLTGEDTSGRGDDAVDLEPIKVEEARVHPPESIYAAADRHLRRHGLIHWDSPDGRIVIGKPNDEQEPIYSLYMRRHDPRLNNTLGATRSKDWSGIPSAIRLFGVGGKRGTARTKIHATVVDEDVQGAGFNRPVTIVAEAVKTNDAAERAARRELVARSKQKDSWEIEVDGFGWWNGVRSIPWAVDTTCRIESDVAGGTVGAYYLHRVSCRRDYGQGDVSSLSLVRRGVWVL